MKKFIMNNWKKILIVIGAAFIIYNVSNILSTGSTVLNTYKNRGLISNENQDNNDTKPIDNNESKDNNNNSTQNNNAVKEENNNEVKQEEGNNSNTDSTNITHDELPARD